MIHTITEKVSEVLSCAGKSLEVSNNKSLLTLMFQSKFKATYGPILLIAWCFEISIMDIICQNINPIKSNVGEVYAYNLI